MYQTTSAESRAALPIGRLQSELLSLYAVRGDLTDKEAAWHMQCAASTVSGVRVPLVKSGKVEAAGKRICHITSRTVLSWRKRNLLTQSDIDTFLAGAEHAGAILESKAESNQAQLFP